MDAHSCQPAGACSMPLTPVQLENKGFMWVMGSFLICPCHLPLTMAVAGTLLGGTAAGVVLRAHPLAAAAVITIAWAAGTWRGILLFRAARRRASTG